MILNYEWTESEQEYKETVIYNVTFLITLIQNVDWITINSNMVNIQFLKKFYMSGMEKN